MPRCEHFDRLTCSSPPATFEPHPTHPRFVRMRGSMVFILRRCTIMSTPPPPARPTREAEQAFEIMQRERESAARRDGLLRLGWDERLSAMAASLRQLAPVLAVSGYPGITPPPPLPRACAPALPPPSLPSLPLSEIVHIYARQTRPD